MKALLIVGLVVGLASDPLWADCVEPPPLTHIPKGATASREQMLAALQAVSAYNAAVTDYLECMDKSGGATALRDVAFDRLNRTAEKFNAELRAFKARNGG